ncbi:hypothetical protein CSB07_00700 [Candidatus Gracilibacteria bacterium]|nr:MAG: hypothetical protein CSB07_00700 [Candidatus Gracilibacteria bacterium]
MKNIFKKHKIIAIDCDEVLAASFQYFLDYFDIRKKDGKKAKFSDLKYYIFCRNDGFLGENEEYIEKFIKLYLDDEKNLKLPPVSGALEGIKKLKKFGKKLYIITARQEFLKNYTKSWLGKYFGEVFEDIIFCNHEGGGVYKDKSQICKEVGATLLIEDNLDYALECSEKGVEVILFEKPWNSWRKETNSKIFKVKGWKN